MKKHIIIYVICALISWPFEFGWTNAALQYECKTMRSYCRTDISKQGQGVAAVFTTVGTSIWPVYMPFSYLIFGRPFGWEVGYVEMPLPPAPEQGK